MRIQSTAVLIDLVISMSRLTVEQREEVGTRAANGEKISVVARAYRVSEATVRRWHAEAKGSKVWTDKPRPGAPKQLTGAQQAKAKRLARNKYKVSQIVPRVTSTSNKPVSSSTVARRLKDSKAPLHYVLVRHSRSLSAVNKQKRDVWCFDHLNAQTGTWLYGGSKVLNAYGSDVGNSQWEWRDIDEEPTTASVSNPYTLHFYGLVGLGFKSPLIFTAPTPPVGSKARKGKEAFSSKHFAVVAKKLHSTIKAHPKYSNCYKLVLDGAKQHTSAASKAFMDDLGLKLLQDFPPQSWDINIIENVWGVLQTKQVMMRGRRPSTPAGWRARVKKAWDSIDQATIDKLVKKVKRRIGKIHQKGGAWLTARECREC